KTKKLLLVDRVDLVDAQAANRFFATYADALAKKYAQRTGEKREAAWLSFDTSDGGVFLKCVGASCVSLEGGDKALFEKLDKKVNWESPSTVKFTEKRAVEAPRRDERTVAYGHASVADEVGAVAVSR